MSVIRKTPYIETVIGSLTADQIGTLTSYINGSGTPTTVQLGSAAFAALSGIQLLNLKIDNLRTVSGFLIKTASYCTFISYHGNSEKLIISDINTTTWTITDIEEFLTIEELRRVIDDTYEATGAEFKTINGESIIGAGDIAISGGTQLYQHTASISVWFEGQDYPATCKIIATSNQSFKNKVINRVYSMGYILEQLR